MASNTRPYIKQPVTLYTYPAQGVFKRHWQRMASASFNLATLLRQLTTEENAAQVEKALDEATNDLMDRIKQEKERFQKTRDDVGAIGQPQYTAPLETSIEISSPRAGRLLAMLQQFDYLMVELDALWLHEAITDGPYNQHQRQWERQFSRLAGRIQSATGYAINAAKRSERTDLVENLPENQAEGKQSGETGDQAGQHSSPAPSAEAAPAAAGAGSS
jgi:hypothetical protein